MRWEFLLIFIALYLLPVSVQSQRIVNEPICFQVINEAPYKIYGRFSTDRYIRPDGIKTRHRSNFRLEEAGSVHEEGYPIDRAEFCSYGPFYPEFKLDLTLRTLVPIFDCRTRIDQGAIIIQGRRKPEGGTETKAICFD
ncbi:MAG: hypothetical protein KAJ86_05245 [Alphaproteobacteria bacterium]|nr:hypothetical protein [Alphaproteobacteria bacterium]